MTIKELEQKSGMERATIRYYEKEGIIQPTRMENNYRDYSEDDLELLLRIKLLRSLHISLEDIRALKSGITHLNITLTEQLKRLEHEEFDIRRAKDLCQMIKDDNATFETLDANKYLNYMPKKEEEPLSAYFQISADVYESDDLHPWKRFFARTLDWTLYGAIVHIILAFCFQVTLIRINDFWNAVALILHLVLMLFVEPLFLKLFQTTPGKFVFGFYLSHFDGSSLTYQEGFERTKKVLIWGWGLGISILNAIFSFRSYRRCINNESQPWDMYGIKFSARVCSYGRWACIPLYIMAYFSIFISIVAFQFLPPNRGDLTMEQFVENFRYYQKYYDIPFGEDYLDFDGTWKEQKRDGYFYHTVGLDPFANPSYSYKMDGEYVTGVSFVMSAIGNEEDWILMDSSHAQLVSLALYGTQGTILDFLSSYDTIINTTYESTFKDTVFEANGIVINSDAEYKGYSRTDIGILIPNENTKEYSYQYIFSVEKK